jgi:hypothetical protein
MYLVRNGRNDYKFRAERPAMVLQNTQVSDLTVGKFGHRSGKKLAFDFFRSFVRSWIGRIHQFGIDQPRRRKRERPGVPPKGDGAERTQENQWLGFIGKDPQLSTKLVGKGVDEDWEFQSSIELLQNLGSRSTRYRPSDWAVSSGGIDSTE